MSNMVVRTNVFALNAHRNMKNVGLEQGRASNRLSSGFRINSAADDAAGLAISENMRAQIRGLDQASRNAQDGQAMLLTTEGGLEEIGNMLQRVRELLVQGSNDTNTQEQRNMMEQEINQLGQEIASMQQRVEFNTNRVLAMGPALSSENLNSTAMLQLDSVRLTAVVDVLNGNAAEVNSVLETLRALDSTTAKSDLNDRLASQVENALRSLEEDIENVLERTNPGAEAIGSQDVLDGVEQQVDESFNIGDVITGAVAPASTGDFSLDNDGWGVIDDDDLISTIIGALQDRLSAITDAMNNSIATIQNNLVDNAEIIMSDAREFRSEPTSGNNIAFFQVGANANQGIRFDFEDVSRAVSVAANITNVVATMVANPGVGSGIGNGIVVTEFISQLGDSIADISNVRANLGAVQNRMDYTMRSLDISSENLQDSESRVRNADVAREMMRFTMANVLQQASVSMLSQANQLPNNLLQLLR